jgi:glycosyltransferase involved in cell wall biosynthesis
VASLLRARQHYGIGHSIVGLTDGSLAPMPIEYRQLVDSVSFCWNPVIRESSVFISASPMTHDPAMAIRFQSHPSVLCAAIIYDFIPLDREGYFPAVSDRIEYFANLAHLKSCHRFLPISEYSAKRLTEVAGVPRHAIRVTGAAVRDSLYAEAARAKPLPTLPRAQPPYFLTVGGGDRRKNTETAVRAVRLLRAACGEPLRLKVVGHYGADYTADLIRVATENGSDNFLQFYSGISDADLVRLYADALATIAPSHIEGFSLPVVEAAVCGSPVIASTCAAHLELIDDPDALFPSAEPDVLCDRLEVVYRNPEVRSRLIEAQASLALRYREDAVGRHFWEFVAAESDRRAPVFASGARPRIAFLTPYPPQASGVSRFSELTIQAARNYLDIDVVHGCGATNRASRRCL